MDRRYKVARVEQWVVDAIRKEIMGRLYDESKPYYPSEHRDMAQRLDGLLSNFIEAEED